MKEEVEDAMIARNSQEGGEKLNKMLRIMMTKISLRNEIKKENIYKLEYLVKDLSSKTRMASSMLKSTRKELEKAKLPNFKPVLGPSRMLLAGWAKNKKLKEKSSE